MSHTQSGYGQYDDPRRSHFQAQNQGQYGAPAAEGYQSGPYQSGQALVNGEGVAGATSGYGYQYASQTSTPQGTPQPSQYNPQHYAQASASAHYPVQSLSSTQYGGQPSYNPSAYANTPHIQGSPRMADHYRQPSYNPGDYHTTQYSPALQQQSSSASYLHLGHNVSTSVPPPVPPRPNSETPATLSTYTSYAPPVPQRASSYEPATSSLPYPDYQQQAIAMPGFESDPFYYPPSTSSQAVAATQMPSEPASYTPYRSPAPSTATEVGVHATPPPPPVHGSQRNSPNARHPQSRPLPGPPESDVDPEPYGRPQRSDTGDYNSSMRTQNDLFDELEITLLGTASPSSAHVGSPSSRHGGSPNLAAHSRRAGSRHANNITHSPIKEDDSDPEALAGLEAMRMDEAEEERRNRGTGHLLGGEPKAQAGYESDDYANVDMGLYGGGYEGHMSYGASTNVDPAGGHTRTLSSSAARPRISGREMSYDSVREVLQQPLPPISTVARVDSGGTGGLVDPSTEPPSAAEDDGDAYSFTDEIADGGEMPDLFFHPSQSPALYRPLPPPPSSTDSIGGADTPTTAASVTGYPLSESVSLPHTYQSDKAVPRFISLREQNTMPAVPDHPLRANTDSRPRKPGLHTSVEYHRNSSYALPDTPTGNQMTLDLPSLPSKRFNVSKLGPADFKKCERPWALSSIYTWLRYVANPEQVTELKESMVKEAVVALFTYRVPTINITDAETLSSRVVQEMYDAGTLRPTEEWVRLAPGHMSGVIFQLTQNGCYSPKLHDHPSTGRCYSHYCQRTLKKVNLQKTPSRAGEDWVTFYKLKKDDLEGVDRREIERQNILHEIVQTEDQFMGQIDVLQIVYRDALSTAEPPIFDQKKLKSFLRDVFGKVDAVRRSNEDHLLAQLKYRQDEQGPFVKGFSDIFRQWIRKAKSAYVEYAAAFPAASLLVRQEQDRNLHFRDFLDRARVNKASNRLGLDTYLKAPITRLQRYSLLLATVLKNMRDESDEKKNLEIAINEIREVTRECDARVAEMQRKVDLVDLGQKLILRPGMQQEVELNLNHLGRRLVHQGVLQRTGGSRFNWVDSQVLLFDHYMILAKAIFVVQRETGAKVEKYDVSRFPIPMDLLVLEGLNDDPVRQSHYVRGISTVSSVPRTPGQDATRTRSGTNTASPNPSLDRTITSSSLSSLNSGAPLSPAVTVTEGTKEGEKILYPFRVRHLGRDTYTLFAQSANVRAEWGAKITEAKTRHAKSLYQQNAEPFRLRVLADAAFGYDSLSNASTHKPIIIEDTPTDRAIKEVESRYRDTGRPSPICRSKINCATSFFTAYPGKHMLAVGTDFGVYTAEIDNPRGWTKAIAMPKVTQITVLEDFNVFLLISSGSLIAYHLEVVTTPTTSASSAAASEASSARRAPQKLSGTRDVGFFAVGRMKERTLVFYKKRDGLTSTFKVLEPVFQKATEKKRSMFKRGNTDFFRDYDEFYIPTECSGMNLFSNSLSVSTSKGFEVLTLDKKQTFNVPDLRAPEVANIAQHIDGQATLGMLRLSDQEFLLCYEKCAVYVNKHGDVSRSVIMNFVGRARAAALYGAYLILFDQDFVEVRNAQNGRLKQIIAGNDVRCLDDGGGGSLSGGSLNSAVANGAGGGGLGAAARTVKVALTHPRYERTQMVVELILNEGMKD